MPYVLSKMHDFIFPTGTLSLEQKEALNTLESQFDLQDETLQAIVGKIHSEMDRGLRDEGGNLLMVPSYVTGRPKNDEKGEYLALDFGGTNCRICLVKILGAGEVHVTNEKFKFSNEQLKEHGSELFSSLAEFIGEFVEKQTTSGTIPKATCETPLKLGFTFSFPVSQTSLTKGKLVRWTKGFENPGVVGQEITKLLQDALDKRDIPVSVNALVNDTVGTLITSSYLDPSSQMGLILGTGTNAAYYELTENITKLPEDLRSNCKEMVVNIEWGAFDNDKQILPLTEYDVEMDKLTPNPTEQTFEKTVSGFYLGELFRIIISHFYRRGLVFSACGLPSTFKSFGGVDTVHLSSILKDATSDLSGIAEVVRSGLKIVSKDPIPLADRIILKKVSELVGRRAAQLAGAASAAVLLKRPELMDKPVTVGVDGSVYEFFPYFPLWMDETVAGLVGPSRAHNIRFAMAQDGSGVGAALISMIAHDAESSKVV